MIRNCLLTFLTFFLANQTCLAQQSSVQGTITDVSGKIPLQGPVILKTANEPERTVYSNEKGQFVFLNLKAGDYILEINIPFYTPVSQGFTLGSNDTRQFNFKLGVDVGEKELGPAHVRVYRKLDPSTPGVVIKPHEPFTNPGGLINTLAAGSDVMKTRNSIQFPGRPEQTLVFNNGFSQLGPLTPLSLNLGQVRTIAGGVPAMYGDFTGGAIEITTASVLNAAPFFSVQLNSSQFFNPYNQNSIETNYYKPLLRNREGEPIFGFSHSLYAGHQNDPDPFRVPLYYVRQELIDSLNRDPFETNRDGTELPVYFFFTPADLLKTSKKENGGSANIYNQFNLQYNPTEHLQFALQSSFQYNRQRIYSFSNALFNSDHNPLFQSYTGKINFQMSQVLKKPYDNKGTNIYDSSLVSALSYRIILDYQRYNTKQTDPIYGDNVFSYGYLGAFETGGQALYEVVEQPTDLHDQNGQAVRIRNYHKLVAYADTSMHFIAASQSDPRSAYNRYLMAKRSFENYSDLQNSQGLLNGQNPNNVYSLWYAPGTTITNYSKSDVQKASIMAMVNLALNPTKDLGYRHDLELGLLFENRTQSAFSLNATGLWLLMPQLLNRQFVKLDTDNPVLSYDARGRFTDTVNYNWIIDNASQSTFDRNLRAIVSSGNGHHLRNAHFIDVQSVNPGQLSLNMFSADELLNNGNTYVSYSGYDYTGRLQRGNTSLKDFLNNPAQRTVGSFNPLYSAIWIQDKFALNEINFRAGLRIERYDANQYVLNDPFCLYPVHTAAEVSSFGAHPSTIGDDYYVYVDDMNNPTKIAGYRSGNKWFDAGGNEINSPELIRNQSKSGRIQPYLVNPEDQKLSLASFKDYEPQILVLPRLSFSFPISANAVFYAYYDQFAQRPNAGQSFSPVTDFYFMQNRANRIIANPGLQPSKRTDYQIGFKQMLGDRSSLNITAKYAEIKDDINLIRMEEAYPVSYTTYGNLDFSTIKSLKVEYEAAFDKIYMRANYTLQYADGTGSNVNSQQALIASNQPNLRSLYPLSYDIRHRIGAYVNIQLYELGEALCSPLYRDMSMNILFNTQSGTPFTALQQAVPEAQSLGVVSRSQIKGNPYGSRLPWNSSLDLSIIKGFMMGLTPFELQLNVQNLLNTLNIFEFYPYSGLAGDDGFLNSPAGQQQLRNEIDAEAFAYLYSLKQQNPGHFGAPRLISITCRAHF